MHRLLLFVLLAALCLPAADKKPKGKLPDIVVLDFKVHRQDGRVTLDGKVKNGGEKTLRGVILIFDFFAPSKVPVTTQKTNLDEENLEPGREASFRAEMVDPVRAVEVLLSAAEDGGGRDLRLAKTVRTAIE